jgi:hypothetical protein
MADDSRHQYPRLLTLQVLKASKRRSDCSQTWFLRYESIFRYPTPEKFVHQAITPLPPVIPRSRPENLERIPTTEAKDPRRPPSVRRLGPCSIRPSQSSPKRSTLSYANTRRPWQLFDALFYAMLEVARSSAPGKRLRFKNKLFSLDATIVEPEVESSDSRRCGRPKDFSY